MNAMTNSRLQLEDIQAGALQARPSPYVGAYFMLRVDDRRAGREFLKRILPALSSAENPSDPAKQAWLLLSVTATGLTALGVEAKALDSFPPEFRAGMAARAAGLGDIGENAPEHWEAPLGTPDVHLVVVALAPDVERFGALVEKADAAFADLAGVTLVYRQDVHSLPGDREHFGFRDGIGQPAIEGLGIAPTNRREAPLKAGEFIIGYQDETGDRLPVPQPEILGRNGTFMVVRKLATRVAAFRTYVRSQASDVADEELVAAKLMGRWRSGAPLALAPDGDDAALGEDRARNNDFQYGDDPRGLRCPFGAHARRMHPRDSVVVGEVRLHRMIRRGTTYGPPLPEGALEDDGVERGLMFAFIGAHIARQFEFVQTEWVNDGKFFGSPGEKDPIAGGNDGTGRITIPTEPIRRRLNALPAFVVNRGGEYCFVPGLTAVRWLAGLTD